MEKYVVRFEGKSFEVLLDPKDPKKFKANGVDVQIELLKKIPPNIYFFLVNNKVVLVTAKNQDNGSIKATIDGFELEVEVTSEASEILRNFIKESGDEKLRYAKIKAPMPGLVVKVLFQEGSFVNKGDKVIIIEAMKMENALSSPISGKIQKVLVKEGDAVEKDALLMEVTAD